MDVIAEITKLKKLISDVATKRIGKNNIIPASISQTHLISGSFVIIFDIASNRPTAGTDRCKAFFATDTNVLSLWNGSAWKTQTFT